MGNMSYCRFENTLSDLQDCYESMDESCSEREHKKRQKLIKLCWDIASNYCDEDGNVEELDYEKDDTAA